MPFYEYQCGACAHRLEMLQKISDSPLRDCPKCGEARLQKLISKAGFRLKGGGWYETDFKNKGKEASKSGDSADSKSGEGGKGSKDGGGGTSTDKAKSGKSGGADGASAKSTTASKSDGGAASSHP